MRTEETLYIKILIWAYKKQEAGFKWEELQKEFTFKKIATISAPFGFIELKVITKLFKMQKENKAIFYYKAGVPHYDKIIYECKLK